jgi:hypothetical protein
MKKIIIDNRDLDNITIDAYQTFILEDAIERDIDCYNEENGTEYDEEEFNIESDYEGWIESLAMASIECIENELKDNEVIKNIRFIKSKSPKYYNYTTDSYEAEYTYEDKKLIEWIADNEEGWRELASEWDYYMHSDIKSIDLKSGEVIINRPVYDEKINNFKDNIEKIHITDNEDIICSMIAYYIKENIYQNASYANESYLWDMLDKLQPEEFITMKKKNDEEEGL